MPSDNRRSAVLGIALAVVASLIIAVVVTKAVHAFYAPATVTVPPPRVIGH